jgi:PAS domain S-box-containing protein
MGDYHKMIKILIIDDSAAIVGMVRNALQQVGHEVFMANNGETGIRKAEHSQPDLILLDIVMPGLYDGYQTCEKLKENVKTQNIPVIFMSTLSTTEEKVKAFNVGAVDYVTKPIQTQELLSRVNTHLTIRKLQQQLQDTNKILEEKVEKRTEELRQTNTKLQQEIAEKVQAEIALRASEAKFRKIVQNLPIGLSVNDKTGKVTFMNNKFCEIFSISGHQNLRIEDWQQKISDDPKFRSLLSEIWNHDIQRVKSGETEKTPIREYSLHFGENSERHVELIFTVAEGETYTLVNDITEKKNAEAELQKLTERFLIAKESANIGVWEIDLLSKKVFWDEIMYSLTNLPPNEPDVRKAFLANIHPDDIAEVEANLSNSIRSDSIYEVTYRLYRNPDEIIYIREIGKVFYDGLKQPNRVIGISMDITKTKELEKEIIAAKDKAEESNRLKTVFLQNMSHEVRTPMNAIIGFADLLGMSDISEQKKQSYLEIIQQKCFDLLEIITEVLDLSTYETGQYTLSYTVRPLDLLLNDIYEFFQFKKGKAGKQNLKFTINNQLDREQSVFQTDFERLRQILINLVENAFKFTDSGFIELNVNLHDPEKLLFTVSDSGIGIAEDKHKIIFERFRQADEGDNRKYGGTGLGLTIAKFLVEKMGGAIWVESVPGVGSSFQFTLPYNKCILPGLPSIETGYLPKPSWDGALILVIDKTDSFIEITKNLLSSKNAGGFRVNNIKSALDLLAKKKIDLILLGENTDDYYRPEGILRIKGEFPETPLVYLTDKPDYHEKKKCYENAADRYSLRPDSEENLLKILSNYFG